MNMRLNLGNSSWLQLLAATLNILLCKHTHLLQNVTADIPLSCFAAQCSSNMSLLEMCGCGLLCLRTDFLEVCRRSDFWAIPDALEIFVFSFNGFTFAVAKCKTQNCKIYYTTLTTLSISLDRTIVFLAPRIF